MDFIYLLEFSSRFLSAGIYGDYMFVRNPEYNGTGKTCMYTGDKPDYENLGTFISAPVKKGWLWLKMLRAYMFAQ